MNDLPRLPFDDNAVFERVHIFHFTEYIPPEQRSERIRDQAVSPAVTGAAWLWWGIQGYRRLRDEFGGRLVLASTTEETRKYRDTQDNVAQFIAECCEEGAECSTDYGVFRRAFTHYLKQNSIHELYSSYRLSKALQGRKYEKTASNGATIFSGVQVQAGYLYSLE